MEKLGKWLGKKKPERSSRVTRSAAAPSVTRASYNEDIIPVEMLDMLLIRPKRIYNFCLLHACFV